LFISFVHSRCSVRCGLGVTTFSFVCSFVTVLCRFVLSFVLFSTRSGRFRSEFSFVRSLTTVVRFRFLLRSTGADVHVFNFISVLEVRSVLLFDSTCLFVMFVVTLFYVSTTFPTFDLCSWVILLVRDFLEFPVTISFVFAVDCSFDFHDLFFLYSVFAIRYPTISRSHHLPFDFMGIFYGLCSRCSYRSDFVSLFDSFLSVHDASCIPG